LDTHVRSGTMSIETTDDDRSGDDDRQPVGTHLAADAERVEQLVRGVLAESRGVDETTAAVIEEEMTAGMAALDEVTEDPRAEVLAAWTQLLRFAAEE
jgi:hypothetical protein